MNSTEPEFVRLREFRAELAEAGEDRLARVRSRVENAAAGRTAASPVARRRVSRRAVVIPAVAAASVLAVVLGAATVGLGGSSPWAGNDPASQPRSPEPSPTAAPPTEKTRSTPALPGPSHRKAATDLLESFAAAAGTGPAPLTVPDGQLLYVRGEGQASGSSASANGGPVTTTRLPYVHELWLDVNGAIALRIRRTDGDRVSIDTDEAGPKNNQAEQIAEQRARLAEGPSLDMPTPAYLAGLPTDPDAMLALLRSWVEQGGGAAWSTDYLVVKSVRELLYNNEPLITPQVRAALYRALAKLDSVFSTGQRQQIDGRWVYAIAQMERDHRLELLLDAETGRVVGSSLSQFEASEPEFYDLWSYAVVGSTAETG
jgi:hypothetical protein